MKKQIDTKCVVEAIMTSMLYCLNSINDITTRPNEESIMADWRCFKFLFYTLFSIFKRAKDNEVIKKLKEIEECYPILELPYPQTIDVVGENLSIRYSMIEFEKWVKKQQEAEEENNDKL